MKLVNLNLYVEPDRSSRFYNEDLFISKDLYEKIEKELEPYNYYKNGEQAEKIAVYGLDGKHSETSGYVAIAECKESANYMITEFELKNNVGSLYCKVESICNNKELNLDEDIEKVKNYLSSINSIIK